MGAVTGFANAPVSKGLCLLVVGASFLASYAGVGRRMTLDVPRIMRGEAWRLLTSQVVFQEHPQTLLGGFLLYTFRQFERQMGSRKFGSFLFITTLLATSLQMIGARFLRLIPASGPFGAIYALFVLFYATVPKLQPRLVGFFGVDVSDKSMYYAVGAQLLFGGSWATALPALSGLLAGLLYRSNALALQRFQLPQPLCRILAMLGPLLNARRESPRQRRQRRQGGGGREQLIPAAMPRFAQGAPAAVEPPSEEAIQTLMGLGFERAAVIRALQASGNNVEVAANRLLAGGG